MRVRYTLSRNKLLKKDYEDIKHRKLKDNAVSQVKAADVINKYIAELNRVTPKSLNEQ